MTIDIAKNRELWLGQLQSNHYYQGYKGFCEIKEDKFAPYECFYFCPLGVAAYLFCTTCYPVPLMPNRMSFYDSEGVELSMKDLRDIYLGLTVEGCKDIIKMNDRDQTPLVAIAAIIRANPSFYFK